MGGNIDRLLRKLKQSEGAHVGHSRARRVQKSGFVGQTRQNWVRGWQMVMMMIRLVDGGRWQGRRPGGEVVEGELKFSGRAADGFVVRGRGRGRAAVLSGAPSLDLASLDASSGQARQDWSGRFWNGWRGLPCAVVALALASSTSVASWGRERGSRCVALGRSMSGPKLWVVSTAACSSVLTGTGYQGELRRWCAMLSRRGGEVDDAAV